MYTQYVTFIIRIVIKADPLEMANAITPPSHSRCPEDVNRSTPPYTRCPEDANRSTPPSHTRCPEDSNRTIPPSHPDVQKIPIELHHHPIPDVRKKPTRTPSLHMYSKDNI